MLYVHLPAYNEEKSLPPLLDRFAELFPKLGIPYRIVIVDDGSSDRTAEVTREYAKKMNVELVPHPRNMGLGAAMRTGFEHIAAEARPEDYILTMDADDTHNPEIVPGMMRMAEEGKDVVIASRYEQGGQEVGLALDRKILSRGASGLLGTFFPIPGAKDYTCGFRLYRASIVQKAVKGYGERFITTNTFVCMAEILIKLARIGARVGEVPLVLRYDRKQGESKMKKMRTIARYLGLIVHETVMPTRAAK